LQPASVVSFPALEHILQGETNVAAAKIDAKQAKHDADVADALIGRGGCLDCLCL
jgi:hypothetical protein